MFINTNNTEDDFFPRMIIWQLGEKSENTGDKKAPTRTPEYLSTHECLLTIDSISRVSKPIIVLAGDNIINRPDLFQIVEYGFALGLKMIVEVLPDQVSDEVLAKFVKFGPKVFRVVVDGSIEEDMDTRFKQSKKHMALEECVRRLKKSGYEIHLGINIAHPDLRKLAFEHDFALQKSANGLYCDLDFESPRVEERKSEDLDTLIEQLVSKIAQMKRLSPKGMYFSPQCIKYGLHDISGQETESPAQPGHNVHVEWTHWCLSGKSFIFIGPTGIVQPCASMKTICGSLRENNYNFKKIWFESDILQQLRQVTLPCTGVRKLLSETSSSSYTETGNQHERTQSQASA